MSTINFKPWIGQNYSTKGYKGKRIMILGESHYCLKELALNGRCYPKCDKKHMKDDCFTQTQDVVSQFVYGYVGEKYLQTFLCFERAVVGKELSQEEREEFWNGVIFYNYIQYSQPKPRVAPQPEFWKLSEEPFKELLTEYMPDIIVVWGNRLYNGLPDWGGIASKLFIDENNYTDVWTYVIKGKEIPAIKVHHPSSPSGKSWGYWHHFFEKVL